MMLMTTWYGQETDTELIFGDEDEIFHSFGTKDVAAASANINKLLMEFMTVINICIK